ncbi:hypothetical protein DQ04_19641010 [Trypanosoma grayi]|uniref:hypothetical protein n=1 Tax=Trypanosoma grayi TaxID=71804 RepID=UPI0004F3F6CA|nr:hypothetical protein DQ04_19641010 [Trypanosoma grayi]KEG05653.1 hypothetical protein DQ04_19641010 [Trypanosoma grayi]
MKCISQVINFTMRMPEKSSFVARTRLSTMTDILSRIDDCQREMTPCTGKVTNSTDTPASAHQPTRRYSSATAASSTSGALRKYITYQLRSPMLLTSVLAMFMMRPTLISGSSSDFSAMVRHFSKSTTIAAFSKMAAARILIWSYLCAAQLCTTLRANTATTRPRPSRHDASSAPRYATYRSSTMGNVMPQRSASSLLGTCTQMWYACALMRDNRIFGVAGRAAF